MQAGRDREDLNTPTDLQKSQGNKGGLADGHQGDKQRKSRDRQMEADTGKKGVKGEVEKQYLTP